MWIFGVKILTSAVIISFCSWLSNKRPDLAGFIVALPLTTMIVLLFSFAEFRDSAKSVEFATSIFIAVPLSLLFFVPFALSSKLGLNFSLSYVLGTLLLGVGYLLHRWIWNLL